MPAVVTIRTRASKNRTELGLDNVVPPGSASCALGRRLVDDSVQVIERKIDVAYEKSYAGRYLPEPALKPAKK